MIPIQLDHYVLCEMRGLNANEVADCLGILPSSARQAASRFGLKFADTPHRRNRKPIIHEGIEYASRSDLARVMGISVATVWHHVNRGTVDRIGATDNKRIRRPKDAPKVKLSASPKAVSAYVQRAK